MYNFLFKNDNFGHLFDGLIKVMNENQTKTGI